MQRTVRRGCSRSFRTCHEGGAYGVEKKGAWGEEAVPIALSISKVVLYDELDDRMVWVFTGDTLFRG